MPKETILTIIADNALLFDELKKVFEAQFEPTKLELSLNNEELGERIRARLEAKVVIERAFSKILSYQTPVSKEDAKNPAR